MVIVCLSGASDPWATVGIHAIVMIWRTFEGETYSMSAWAASPCARTTAASTSATTSGGTPRHIFGTILQQLDFILHDEDIIIMHLLRTH